MNQEEKRYGVSCWSKVILHFGKPFEVGSFRVFFQISYQQSISQVVQDGDSDLWFSYWVGYWWLQHLFTPAAGSYSLQIISSNQLAWIQLGKQGCNDAFAKSCPMMIFECTATSKFSSLRPAIRDPCPGRPHPISPPARPASVEPLVLSQNLGRKTEEWWSWSEPKTEKFALNLLTASAPSIAGMSTW